MLLAMIFQKCFGIKNTQTFVIFVYADRQIEAHMTPDKQSLY